MLCPPTMPTSPFSVPLPKSWPKHAKAATLHIISLTHFVLTRVRGFAVNSPIHRVRLAAERDRLFGQAAHRDRELPKPRLGPRHHRCPSAGFWTSWLPFSFAQSWPFCWWVTTMAAQSRAAHTSAARGTLVAAGTADANERCAQRAGSRRTTTEAMQQRYSTVALEEMREGIGKVISMAKMKEAMAVTSHGGVQGGVHDAKKRKGQLALRR